MCPIYEYKCETCEDVKEIIYPIGKAPKEIECDKCNEIRHRIISGSTFILKGGGWFASGYSKGSK